MQRLYFSLLFFSALALFACGEKKASNSTSSNTSAVAASVLPLHCYKWESADGSKMLLRITEAASATSIRGSLEIAIAEKDANKGTFSGSLQQNGALLVAEYTFMSEGAQSRRTEVFLRNEKGDSYILGTSPIDPATGLPDVRDLSKVEFDPSMSLNVAPCQ